MSFNTWTKVKKTRKDHKCNGCNCKIPQGSKAFKAVGFYEDFFSVYFCEICEAYSDFNKTVFQDEWDDFYAFNDYGAFRAGWEAKNKVNDTKGQVANRVV